MRNTFRLKEKISGKEYWDFTKINILVFATLLLLAGILVVAYLIFLALCRVAESAASTAEEVRVSVLCDKHLCDKLDSLNDRAKDQVDYMRDIQRNTEEALCTA